MATFALLKLFTFAGANIDTRNINDIQSINQVENIRTAGAANFGLINAVNYNLFDGLGAGGQTERALMKMICLNAPNVGV